MTSVLMVVTAARYWTLTEGTKHPTEFWAEEFVVPYATFAAARWHITIATPGGQPPVVDQLSLGLYGVLPHKTRKIKRELDQLQSVLAHPMHLSDAEADAFDPVFYPGGHGPMEDLACDTVSGDLLTTRLPSGQPLALLCHAPAAILAAKRPDGTSPFAGYHMTGLSNREERLNRFAKKAPWLLKDKLREVGVEYVKARLPLRPFIVVDRDLYTGQNAQSSEKLANRIVADLNP